MNKLNQLQEAVIELVPEIRELEMGCKVIPKASDVRVAIVTHTTLGWIYTLDYVVDSEEWWQSSKHRKDSIVEIIGRDITLADVLLAMENIRPKPILELHGAYQLDISTRKSRGRDNCIWNLTKPLHLQEQETIDFLHSIIV